ncbi:hypothetical protein LPJ72_000921 [Coemansia sp. Benny D160-2]|nr:hypothetical protein LPJ72_000921 [Coemansia sp. Benny D160-2]
MEAAQDGLGCKRSEPPDITVEAVDAPADHTDMGTVGAVVHKHPFAPTCLKEELTPGNVFRQPSNSHIDHHNSLSSGKAVRVFIGPTDTDWMQKHQHWWSRTAGKLEDTTEVGKKIRRSSASEKTKDSKSDIFSKIGKKKTTVEPRRSVSTLSSLSLTDYSSSEDSDDMQYPEENDSEWSVPFGRASAEPSSAPVAATGQTPVHPSTNSMPHNSSVAASPGDHSPILDQTHPSPSAQSDAAMPSLSPAVGQSLNEHSPRHARRKSGLDTIKGIFRRNSKRREAEKQLEKDSQNQDEAVSANGEDQSIPGTIPEDSVAGDNQNPGVRNVRPGRERATSLSHLPTVRDLPWSPVHKAVVPRASIESNAEIPKLPLLKRVAVKTRSRSVTWQSNTEKHEDGRATKFPVAVTDAQAATMPATSVGMSTPQTDMYLHQMLAANRNVYGGTSVSSRMWRSKRDMLAKVKGYYHRHAQLSETTAILSTRAVVRRETASYAAFSEKYNEATSQRFRQSAQEWSEMWAALTKRGIMLYLSSKTRPTVQVLFPPYNVIAPRVSLYSTLDFSIAITYYTRRDSISTLTKDQKIKSKTDGIISEDTEVGRDDVRVVIVKFPSSQVACDWYREIGQILMVSRVMNPQCIFSSIPPIAQPPPTSVLVNVPEIGIKVQVKLGRHNIEIPSNILLGSAEDSLLERQWRCEATTVWHVRRDVVNALLDDNVIRPQMLEWLDAERKGMMTIGMAWRRYDRLDWILPCGSFDKQGNLRISKVNDKVIGPQLSEGTHRLEMRVLEHYPDSVVVDETRVYEPLAVEGFLMLKREKKHRTELTTYRPALLASHDSFLFFIHAPHAARHMQACASACSSPPVCSGTGRSDYTQCSRELDLQTVRHFHPDPKICSKQMSLAKYMLNITEVEQIVPLVSDPDDELTANERLNDAQSLLDADSQTSSAANRPKSGSSSTSTSHKKRGKVREFLHSKKNKQAACKFKMVTRSEATIVLWAPDERCMHEWVHRLNGLRFYWTNRVLLDLSVRSQVCVLNYSLQGRRYRPSDMSDGSDEQSWADRAVWHACLFLGCRNIIMSGILYRKRHRHQGMRKVFCILSQGRLIEYKFPLVSQASNQSVVAEQMVLRDALMSRLFGSDTNGESAASASGTGLVSGNSGSSPGSHATGLLFSRSRSLSLRRCYVVSRFTDDLNANDIVYEPWVMTDIGNYSGLRLADRIYADGVISHELINDCVFTVWRPTFVPSILRMDNNPEAKRAPNELPANSAEVTDSEWPARAGNTPDLDVANSKPSIKLSPPSETSSRFEVPMPSATGERFSGHQRKGSGDTVRTSNEGFRGSADGYMSSVSNASSNASVRGLGSGKPGAYRVGDKIHLNVDEKNDGSKRMNAVAMVSSMRRRVGVYKARSNAEMEQWVTAINQEIRRMSLAEEW